MSLIPLSDVVMNVVAVCLKCGRPGYRGVKHRYACTPFPSATLNPRPPSLHEVMDEWNHKHPADRGCETLFLHKGHSKPRKLDDRSWLLRGRAPQLMDFSDNANVNFSYRVSSALSNATASLATSSTFLAGYESATIDNTVNLDMDILITQLVTVGTTPTANTVIEIDSISMRSDSAWPDVFDGTESAETITSAGVKQGIAVPLGFLICDATTSNVGYELTKRSLAALYGYVCPAKSCLFTTHNTGVNLNSTAGNHVTTLQGVGITVA